MELVVDSCVVISALIDEDPHHGKASLFFTASVERGDTLWTAATLLWDVAARFVHPEKLKTGATVAEGHDLALRFIDVTSELFYQTQAPTHLRVVGNAIYMVRSEIRGPDHVFLSCALNKRAPLVTWDGKVLKQAHKFGVAVITPEDYMAGKPVGITTPVPDGKAALAEFARRFRGETDTRSG
jgi:predicted nucleic acid-binding protein